MSTKIQLRRGTASQWVYSDPVLSQGEFGVEVDTGKFKIGDGTSTWTTLSYPSGIGGLASLSDVYYANPDDGSVLIYNATLNKWIASVNLDQQNMDGGFY
jgi:Major tropism determinant N-terminal domain